MKKHIGLFAWLLTLGYCTSCNPQDKPELSKNSMESEPKYFYTSDSPISIVRNIEQDRNGNMWIASWEGIFRYDGKEFTNVTRDLTSSRFFSVLEDSKGNMWFATRDNTFVFDGKSFTSVTHLGKPFKNVRSIIEDQKGNIWLGGKDGLWRFNGSTFTNIAKEFVGYIHEDKKGNIWTSSKNSKDWALLRYSEKSLLNKIAVVPEVIKANEGMVFGILEANDGSIWFGTLNGVLRYNGTTVNTVNSSKTMSSQEYFSKLVAKEDNC